MKIVQIFARQIIDSRGTPTAEADVVLDDGITGRAAVPSGASTGEGEALELRDGGHAYGGKGVSKAITNITKVIAPALIGHDPAEQRKLDQTMISLDGTDNKSKLGANAILAVSLAIAKATALAQRRPLYEYAATLIGNQKLIVPMPLMNVINGGKHAADSTDIQEFMIVPRGGEKFSDRLKIAVEVFMALRDELKARNLSTLVGDEGGFAPHLKGNEDALKLLEVAITRAGYIPGEDVVFALDVAASELMAKDGTYHLATEGRSLTSPQMVDWFADLRSHHPIVSIEDGLAEHDWDGWAKLTAALGWKDGRGMQLVGDDLFVTNTKLIQKGIDQKAANAVLIKPNQIGTLSETVDAISMAHAAGWNTVMSHRSGETEDTTIAHLAVGLGCEQIKSGSLSRSERLAKYNELLRIEEMIEPQ